MEKIAIIGSGISGLASAYLLKDKFEVILYEKNDYFGGHARTLNVNDTPVDTGFIVFNHETYYHLTRFLKHLDVPTAKSNMSFGVSIKNGALEYGSNALSSLIAQKSNLLKPSFYKMVRDIFKFNKISKQHLKDKTLDENISLANYLDTLKVGKWFRNYYLLAMGACIWSTPLKKMYEFPALSFIRFFNNHGLLTVTMPVQWYTVQGGSKTYVTKVVEELKKSGVKFEFGASKVVRNEAIEITSSDNVTKYFDKVIFACHSDEAIELLDKPTSDENTLVGAIKYQPNKVILHTDKNIMPKRKKAWSSWNYLSKDLNDSRKVVSLSYWMNNLQPLNTSTDYFVTVNPDQKPDASKIINEHNFSHPVFDKKAIDAQAKIPSIQGDNNTYFCGAYLRYGFHEDGILSAVNVAKILGANTPW
ncbi:NAD(P)/FAD-dependent oxidoreductase [Francisella adeliensis]|uniref:NAD(P)-binding protein n=1 Tax=Francisella adeliensis TaxID=2007306 RepID=A0A2Z4XXZ3_9GAMM|nr:FAD-dependent oxidoreductase [Francisella adeliensis]AXA33342.1 NAD/FAD-binding protein [Francisella adeliensis]MBK2085354.1 FAD-dependent oxidoreductase [Francisella adeliensis]MBK2097084.1 FAD-dependent oxidoreductase [Francisella adeliensis]QIW11571.1 NAD(P)-binding protein [Francisella adeliensis]QIW13446.1 NAD(P)-binding protein [Francisella adeliensis]